MSDKHHPAILENDVFALTAKAQNELHGSATSLAPPVLVVEDEPHLANLLKHVLANEGFNVRTAKDRDEIVAEFRRGPRPDLVLLDVMLPDVDGFEVLQKIRQYPGLENLPVVMLTAKATRDAVLKGLASGADGYITKQFEIDVLVKAVNVVLGLPTGGQTAGANQDPWGA